MIVRTLLALSLAAAAAPTHANADFDRTLSVSTQPNLFVSTGAGHIHIFPGPDTQFHVKAHVYAGWHMGHDVDDRIRRISANPPIQQSGDTVRLGDASDHSLYDNITIDYEIAAPRSVALDLRTGSGEIAVDDLGRFLKAQTGSGSIHAQSIGGSADLHTGSGTIRIKGFSGGLTARTGSGSIEGEGTLTGPAHLQSGSGSIRFHLGSQARYTLNASTGSGSIHVPGSGSSDARHLSTPINGGGPTLEAHTGSGSIEVN